jgi:hypothetical protein
MGEWEPVHAFVEWDSGPRSGIADCGGKPHVYDSDWSDLERLKESTFYLMPISIPELAAIMAVLADQRRHPNWEKPDGVKLMRSTKYPNLMGEQVPFAPLWDAFIERLRGNRASWLRMAGEFDSDGYSDDDVIRLGHSWVPLKVRWTPPVEH